MKKMVDGKRVDMTEAEIADFEARAAAHTATLNVHRIPKRTILERLHAAGKLADADAALNGDKSGDGVLRAEKWYAVDFIPSDDDEARTFLLAIGADPDTILAAP